MNGNSIMRIERPVTPSAGAAADNAADGAVDLGDRVQQYVRNYFPEFRNKELADPPHLDRFYDGLKALPLRQPPPDASPETLNRITIENRKTVYDFVNRFDAGQGERTYRKPVERALALRRSADMLARDIACEGAQKATLGRALSASFATVTGLNSMSTYAFTQAMILGKEEFEVEKEW